MASQNGRNKNKNITSLPEKEFALRNSLLTDLFENVHIKTVKHIFVATFLGLFINTMFHNYFKTGEIKLGLTLIINAFGKFYLAILIWIGFFIMTCFTFFCFQTWANFRDFSPKGKKYWRYWDNLWICILCTYIVFSFRLAANLIFYLDLPPASAATIVIEQTRLLMKVYSFVRTNVPKVLKFKPHSDDFLKLPRFSKFLYFLFAPTLIYRDEYPRTTRIRTKFVLLRLVEIVGVIFYFSFVLDHFFNPAFKDFGKRQFTFKELILSILENTITGILLLLAAFFLVLHSWQNLFAELLCFGDRLFYREWWTCTSISCYFRTWNVVVQDWLYTYIYKDMCENVTNSKVLAKYAVLITSAIVHEWVLTYMFKFFFPFQFFAFFVIGGGLYFIKAPKLDILNILFWYYLALGMGILVSLYGLEYYARLNLPDDNKANIKNFLMPKLFTCDCITF